VVQHLLGSVDQFAAGAPQADDITLLSLRQRRA
jgi:serine phosphatase RsbU (regulator of sigma subunit)